MTVDGIPEGAILVHEAFKAFWWARWNDQPPPTADLMDSRFLAPLSEGEHRLMASAFAKVDDLDQSAFVMALVHRDLPLLFRDSATGQVLQVQTEHLWEQPGHRWLLHEPVASASPGEPLARVDGATLFVWTADLAAFLEHERAASSVSDHHAKRQRLIASVLRLFVDTGGMGEAQARAYGVAIGVRCFDGALSLAEWSRAALQVDEGNHWHRSSPQRIAAPEQAPSQSAPRLPVTQADEPALEPRALRMTWQRRAIASWMLAQGHDVPPHPDMTLGEIVEAVNDWVESGPAYRKTKKTRTVAETTVGKFVREFSMIRPYLRTMRKVEP